MSITPLYLSNRTHNYTDYAELPYQEALSEVNDYLNQFENLDIIGRYGAFKYHDQDGSLYMGILAAENAVSKSEFS